MRIGAFVEHRRGLVLEPVAEPLAADRLEVEHRVRTEVDLADHGDLRRPVRPGPDDETLRAPRLIRRCVRRHPDVVGDGPVDVDVVPTADVQRGQVELAVVRAVVELAEVRIVRSSRAQGGSHPRRDLREQRVLAQRPVLEQRLDHRRHLAVALLEHLAAGEHRVDARLRVEQRFELRLRFADPPGVRGPDRGGPTDPVREPQRAAGAEPRAPVLRARDLGQHRHEVRRAGDGGEPLRVAHVRRTEHPDAPVRPRLLRRPLDRVVAVVHLDRDRLPIALGLEATAGVLVDDGVSGAHDVGRRRAQEAALEHVAPVRGARHEHRERRIRDRAPHVGVQHHAVAHRNRNAALEDDVLVDERGDCHVQPPGVVLRRRTAW